VTKHLTDEQVQMFARLRAIAALGKAEIEANPIPHLDRACRRIRQLELAMQEALTALSGFDDITIWQDEGELNPPVPFREMCLSRNNKAADVLKHALTHREAE
jgi:hypothetical protein